MHARQAIIEDINLTDAHLQGAIVGCGKDISEWEEHNAEYWKHFGWQVEISKNDRILVKNKSQFSVSDHSKNNFSE